MSNTSCTAIVDGLIDNDEKVALLLKNIPNSIQRAGKNHTLLEIKMAKIDTLF